MFNVNIDQGRRINVDKILWGFRGDQKRAFIRF